MKKTLLIVLAVCFVTSPVLAEDASQLKLKSHSTARILSFMPINSPAIFYVKRPVRGAVYSILEAGGLTSVAFGAYFLSQINKGSGSAFGNFGNSMLWALGAPMVIIGSALWMTPWIHTIVATPGYVDGCNQKIKEKAGIVSFYPLVGGDGKGSFYGLNLNYRF